MNRLWLFVATLAVFLLFRPYQGIIHDARLYVGYAMAAIDPDGIGRDIVFVNDGQSKFSVYPVLMRELAETIGPSRAAIVLTYSGLVLWFAAFVAFVRAMLGAQMRDTQIAAVIVLASSLPAFYGGQGVFRVAEFYATPRVFAEACVLAALAAMLTRRTALAVVSLAAGMAFHPLMTAPGFGVALWYHSETRRARLLLCAAAVVVAVVVVLGTTVLSGVGKPFARFDAEWMQALTAKRALVFIRNWRFGDGVRIVVQLVTVSLALPALSVEARRLVQGALVVGGAGLAFSLIGADALSNVLVTQGQAWRGLWLLSTLATVMLGVLLWSVWSAREEAERPMATRDLRRAATLLLMLAWNMVEINSTGLLFALLAVLFWQLPNRLPSFSLPPRGLQAIGGLTIVILLLTVGAQTWVSLTTAWASPDTTMRWAWHNVVATGGPGLLVLISAARMLATRTTVSAITRVVRPSVGAVVLFMIVPLVIDSRSLYQRYVERELDARADGVPAPLDVPPGSTVLWPYADLEPWAFAGASGWGTIVQGIPNVFDRHLAISWARRSERLRQAGLLPVGQTGAETIGVLGNVVEHRVIRSVCLPTDAPGLLAIPMENASHAPRAAIFLPHVPRPLHPLEYGGKWASIMAYTLVRCGA